MATIAHFNQQTFQAFVSSLKSQVSRISEHIKAAEPINQTCNISTLTYPPSLTIQQSTHLLELQVLLDANLKQLLPCVSVLREAGIDAREFSLALNNLNAYTYLINSVLAVDKNARVVNLALSRKAGAK